MDPLKSYSNSLASTKKLNDFDNEIIVDDNFNLKNIEINKLKLTNDKKNCNKL